MEVKKKTDYQPMNDGISTPTIDNPARYAPVIEHLSTTACETL